MSTTADHAAASAAAPSYQPPESGFRIGGLRPVPALIFS
jgi:hypothetical protein